MENNKNLSKNYIYNLSYQVLLIVIPLITTPYISRVLGAEGIGTYSYTLSIVSYFTIFATFGTSIYAQREIAYCQDNAEKRSIIFYEILVFRAILSVLALTVYFLIIMNSQYKFVFMIQSLYIVGVATDVSWYFQGIEEFGKIVLSNAVARILNLICIFVFVNSVSDVSMYIFILAVFPVIGNIILWIYIRNNTIKIRLRDIHPFSHILGAFQLFIPVVATQIYTVLDKTMIGLYTDTSVQNGFYEQAMGIIRLSLTIVTSLATVIIPKISFAFVKGDMEGIKRYMLKSYRFTWAIALPITVGVAMVAELFVPWFMGNGFGEVIMLMQLGSLIILFVGFSNVIGMQYLGPIRKQNITTATVIIGAIINLCMNLILIPRYFAIGAIISSVVAEGCITMCQLVYIICIRKDFKLKDIVCDCWRYVVAVLIMAFILCFIKQFMSPTIINTCIFVCIGGLAYILILLILKDDLLLDALKEMIKIIRKK